MNNYDSNQIQLISNVSDEDLANFFNENKDILMLPIELENGNDILPTLTKRWNKFYKLVESTAWLSNSIKTIKSIGNSILKAAHLYFAGNLLHANQSIQKVLKMLTDSKCVCYLDELYIDMEANNWFRARKSDYGSLTKKDMKHIPFSNRSLINNQRYSINGIPCLYLGTSVYTCWEELNRPASDSFWVNRYWTKFPNAVRVLNLSTTMEMLVNFKTGINEKNFNRSEFIIDFFTAWILQSACSVIVKEPNRNFYEEYIIPQMVMQNIKKFGIDGILYFSVKVKNAYINQYGWLARNLAIPAFADDKDKEYSNNIEQAFFTSSPINLGMYNNGIIPPATPDIDTDFNFARTNAPIPITDEINNIYRNTIFFRAEYELLNSKYNLFPLNNT